MRRPSDTFRHAAALVRGFWLQRLYCTNTQLLTSVCFQHKGRTETRLQGGKSLQTLMTHVNVSVKFLLTPREPSARTRLANMGNFASKHRPLL